MLQSYSTLQVIICVMSAYQVSARYIMYAQCNWADIYPNPLQVVQQLLEYYACSKCAADISSLLSSAASQLHIMHALNVPAEYILVCYKQCSQPAAILCHSNMPADIYLVHYKQCSNWLELCMLKHASDIYPVYSVQLDSWNIMHTLNVPADIYLLSYKRVLQSIECAV